MQSLEHLSRSLIRHLTKCHLVFLQLSLDGAGVAEVENALLEFLGGGVEPRRELVLAGVNLLPEDKLLLDARAARG